MYVLALFGTRSEAIKLHPLAQASKNHDLIELKTCNLGQHDADFLLPAADYAQLREHVVLAANQVGK